MTILDRYFPYWVLSRDLEPNLPCFVGVTPDKSLFFISEEVPEEDRDLWVLHEVREHLMSIGEIEPTFDDDLCLSALMLELIEVPDDREQSYIGRRRQFFERLVSYLEESKDPRGEEFIAQVRGSRDYLRGQGQ